MVSEDLLDTQRQVARVVLARIDGFVLAGSSAIREHGLIDRPTEDVDLFTMQQDIDKFDAAVRSATDELRVHGFRVSAVRRASQFARLRVISPEGSELDVDLGVDWRQDEPVRLAIGPVLSVNDAVGNKVSALYGRAEARDFLDVDAIRLSARFSDEELIDQALRRDPGFEVQMFARQISSVERLRPLQVVRYGVTEEQLEAIKGRFIQWAAELQRSIGDG